jgi:hypothetical protein
MTLPLDAGPSLPTTDGTVTGAAVDWALSEGHVDSAL